MKINQIGSNQIQLTIDKGIILISYSTPVAAILNEGGFKVYKTNKFWSKTTSKHIGNWIKGETDREILEKDQSFFDDLIK